MMLYSSSMYLYCTLLYYSNILSMICRSVFSALCLSLYHSLSGPFSHVLIYSSDFERINNDKVLY